MSSMLCFLCGVVATIAILLTIWIRTRKRKKSACVLVLGDLGRSPRMQYHALSFAKEGFIVDLVGYPGSEPLQDLRNNQCVNIHYLRPPPDLQSITLLSLSKLFLHFFWFKDFCKIVITISDLPRLLGYIVKTLWQSSTLLGKLLLDVRSGSLLVQNPPAIPTIPICWLYCFWSGTQLVIDWHNYAYTIMGLTLGQGHILVRLTRFVEFFFGARADKHFCVTKAMKDDLRDNWNIKLENYSEKKIIYMGHSIPNR